MKLNIVLVNPQIPQNTGNIARTCAVTGARLHLVKPLGFEIDDKKLKRAGLDYWDKLDITYYDSTEEFLAACDGEMFFFTTKGRTVHSDMEYPDNAYIIFGREDAGLPEELLIQHPDNCVRIPMRSTLRSLNLSNAVAIAAYEVLRQWGYPELSTAGELHRLSWDALPEL
jgi:tRNA (cytidine/uridine-2'-O-)-methyltransferase